MSASDHLSPDEFHDDVVAPDVGRVQARRDNSQNTIRLAIFHSNTTGQPQHVYQTHRGWAVEEKPPPGGQAHFRAEPDGRVFKVTRDIKSGGSAESHIGSYRVVRKTRDNSAGLERRGGE